MTKRRGSKTDRTKHRLPPYANQMFLVDFLSKYDELKGKVLKQDFKNFIMMDKSDVFNSSLFLNDITAIDKGQSLIENVPRSLLGDLQPYFKLYLVEGMKAPVKEYLLPFNNFIGFNDMKRSRAGRGVGFRSFSWDYLGSHPGDIDYWINCNLKLYFESPTALFYEYAAADDKRYSFADLIYRRGPVVQGSPYAKNNRNMVGRGRNTHLDYNQKDHRIKIEIGYVPPQKDRLLNAFVEQGLSGGDAIKASNDFRDALRENKVILYLTLVKHTFVPTFSSTDFGFELHIEFVGSIEQAFLSDDANILIRGHSSFEKELQKKEKKAITARTAAIEFKSLSGEEYKIVEDYDLEVLRAGITGTETKKKIKAGLRKKILNDPAFKLGGKLPEGVEERVFNRDITEVYDLMKATSEVSIQKEKMARSPVSKLDTYKLIICKLNDDKKIYNNKIDQKKFLKYSNNRQDYVEQHTLTANEKHKLVKQIEDKDLRGKELQEAQSKLRKHNDKKGARALGMSSFIESEFSLNKTYTLDPNSQKSMNQRLTTMQRRSLNAAIATQQSTLDVEAYDRFIKNELGPVKGKTNTKDTSEGKHFLYWFYYGDLLDAVLDVAKDFGDKDHLDIDLWNKDNRDGALKIILGNIEYVDHVTGYQKLINIAKVPVSLKLWEEFWFKFVVSQLKDVYYLKSFLRDSFVYLVKASLTSRGRLPGDPVIAMTPGVEYLDVPKHVFDSKYGIGQKNFAQDEAFYLSKISNTVPSVAELGDEGSHSADRKPVERILYMFDLSNKPGYLISSDKHKDNKYGVYHLIPGQYNSPLQQISFTKTDQPYWLEAKAFKSGFLQKNTHLSEPYNCNFTIYGNTLLRPGRHIYIRFPYSWFGSPSIDGSESRTLGLGGYFLMTKASNTLTLMPNGGKLDWQTTVQCLWTTFGSETKLPTAEAEPATTAATAAGEEGAPTSEIAGASNSTSDGAKAIKAIASGRPTSADRRQQEEKRLVRRYKRTGVLNAKQIRRLAKYWKTDAAGVLAQLDKRAILIKTPGGDDVAR